jgi:hypothetical protein
LPIIGWQWDQAGARAVTTGHGVVRDVRGIAGIVVVHLLFYFNTTQSMRNWCQDVSGSRPDVLNGFVVRTSQRLTAPHSWVIHLSGGQAALGFVGDLVPQCTMQSNRLI